MAAQSLAITRQGVYPYPVYVATYESGRVLRMTVWQRAGKPWDFARARPMFERRGVLASGHIEWNGETYPDPMTNEAPKAKRVTAKQLRSELTRVVAYADGLHVELAQIHGPQWKARPLTQARELIAA